SVNFANVPHQNASPAINTVAGGTMVLGSGQKVTDTAMLSGGVNPTGTITFTLYNPSNVAVYTDVVTIGVNSGSVTGNGTYDTGMGDNPGGYLPTVVGAYLWTAVYSGDSNNNGAHDNGQNENETVNKAGPNISTTPTFTSTAAPGQYATIGFWHNKNGQALIKSYNGSSTATALGNYLATTFPHLFGAPNPYTSASLASFSKTSFAAPT